MLVFRAVLGSSVEHTFVTVGYIHVDNMMPTAEYKVLISVLPVSLE
jgi:hypothetical protein